MSAEQPTPSPKERFGVRTFHVPKSAVHPLGRGDFGTVERAHIVTARIRTGDREAWHIESAKLHPDRFVTKTFHRTSAVEDARHSVQCYEEFKAAGVTHLPGTHRISDSDPRVVISTFLGENALLITGNAVIEEEMRPTEIDDDSFMDMLAEITGELRRVSARRLLMHYDDAIFFELFMNGGRAERIDFAFADFDNVTNESQSGMTEEEVFRKNVIQATRALFWLMMCQRTIPGADPDSDNWARIANRIQLWADSHGIDAQEVYDEYITELEAIIAAQNDTGESK